MNVIGTGLSGLVGSRITSLLQTDFTFENLSKETGVDIMDFSDIRKRLGASNAPWVFHFAAYTDVQKAEQEKEKGKDSISWNVNVKATQNIVDVCREYGKKLLYISTDYVFDGKDSSYAEHAVPHPISWYGQTKYEGEKIVEGLREQGLIVRINSPYRSFPIGKIDFVHKMIEILKQQKELLCPTDQEFCPTFVDDLGKAIDALVAHNASGTYHVCSKQPITPYHGALAICETFGFSKDFVKETTYDAYFSGKALPPKHAVLTHDKIDTLMTLHTFEEGIEEVNIQEQGGSL